ncbi:MAG: radical SAM family heme chaperone HemW [Terriglobales bacterium]
MPLGLYISVPFCRTKCSFCNFASGVFSRGAFAQYVDRVCADMERAEKLANEVGAQFECEVDSVYLGGGTPTVLDPEEIARLFKTLRSTFRVVPDAEITVECAPGTLKPEMLDALLTCGVNRVSLGVQSFVDQESASVGRLHTRAVILDDLARLRAAGLTNISLDLIAGLPHQTRDSWEYSLAETIAAGVPHVSVYMLEVDEDSRLGRELIAGGTRYHAHFVPDEDTTAGLYEQACDKLDSAGIRQYEISNFARADCQSRHNLKYWTREPYVGFGVDAHSMLCTSGLRSERTGQRPVPHESVRFATPDTLEAYLADPRPELTSVSAPAALEEAYFLGLRLNRGVSFREMVERYGPDAANAFADEIRELCTLGLLSRDDDAVRLTARGRLLSNEVFQRFIRAGAGARSPSSAMK